MGIERLIEIRDEAVAGTYSPPSSQSTTSNTAGVPASQVGSTGNHEYIRGRRNIDTALKQATKGRMTNSGTRRQYIDNQLAKQYDLEQIIKGSNFNEVQSLISGYKDIANKWSAASSKQRNLERQNPFEAIGFNAYQEEADEYQKQMDDFQKRLEKYGISVNGASVDASKYNQIYFDSMKGNSVGASAEYLPANGLLKDSTTLDVDNYLSHVDAEEMQLYNYLAANKPEEAEAYRQHLDNLVQQRMGGERAEQILDKYTAGGRAVSRGAEAFKSGLAGAYNAVVATATGEDRKTSASEYAAEQLRADLLSKGDEWWRTAGFDAMQSIGNMAPGVVAGMVNPTAGMAVFGATSGTMAYQDKLAEGWSAQDARNYGLLVGASEAALGKVIGGIPALGGAKGGLLNKLTSNVDNAIAKAILNGAGQMGSEALEEGLQTLLEPAIVSAIKGTPYDTPELKEVLYSAVLGAVTAAGFNAPNTAIEVADAASAYKGRYGADAQTLVNEAKQIKDVDRSLVSKAQSKLDKGKSISNNTAQQLTTTVNRSRMVDAVEAQINERASDMDAKAARSLANAVVAKSRNESLTNNQKKLIDKNSALAKELGTELDPKNPAKWAQNIGMRGTDAKTYGSRNIVNLADEIETATLTTGEYADARADLIEQGQDKVKYTEDFDIMAEAYGNSENYDSFETAWEAAQQQGSTLTEAQARAAWNAGQAKLQSTDHTPKLNHRGTGAVSFEAVSDGGVVYEAPSDSEVESFKKSARYKYLSELAKRLKVDIVFFKAGAEGINGKYLDGTVYLAVDASPSKYNSVEGYVMMTAAHELTHYIREASPARYAELKDFVIKNLIEKGKMEGKTLKELILAKQNAYANAGVDLSMESVIEEVVADACEMMLKDNMLVAQLKGENITLHGMMSKWLKKFINNVKAAFKTAGQGSDLTAYHAEAKAMDDVFDELQRIWNLGLTEATQAEVVEQEGDFSPDHDGVVVDEAGEPVAMSTREGSVQLSIKTYEDSGRDAFRKYLEKCVASNKLTETEMQEMLDGIEDIYQVCKDFKDEYAPFSKWSDAEVIRDTYGKPVFSVVTPNGDYKMNLDFSLVCRKRRTLDAVFNEMTKRGIIDDFELGQKSVVKINEIIRKHGFETACALCFVDAKRFRQAAMADSFVQLYNELVKSLVPSDRLSDITHFNFGGNEGFKKAEAGKTGIDSLPDKDLDFSHIRDVMREYGKGTVEYKAAKYILENAEGRKLLFRGDFMSSAGFDEVKINNKSILKLYNSKKGTGGPKAAFGDVQYMNEILSKSRSWTPGKAYDVGGVRVQSFSDYVPRMVFDYVQMIYDLAAVQLPAHAYTKEALFVKQFGLTGIKINMSLIPAVADDGIAPGLDARGNYVWAGESFDYATAVEVQNAEGYTENCGTICVGVSDDHIRKLIDDPNIRMVIPYHKSGLNPIVAHMNRVAAFTDYTDKQRTKGSDGVAVKKDFDFNKELHRMGADGDPKLVAQMYLDWCADNGYTPKFADFVDSENYYKLLIDFTVYDKSGKYVPQRAVKGMFPKKGDAFGAMSQLIRSGLEEDAVIEGRRDESIGSIVDEIVRSIPKTEADIAEVPVAQAEGDVEAGLTGAKNSLRFNPTNATLEERVKEVRAMLSIGKTYAQIHAATNLAVVGNGEIHDGIGGPIVGRWSKNDRVGYVVSLASGETESRGISEGRSSADVARRAVSNGSESGSGNRGRAASTDVGRGKIKEAFLADEDVLYMAAVRDGDLDTAQRLVDEAAKRAGYTRKGYHGTFAEFNEFRIGDIGYHVGTREQAEERIGFKFEDEYREGENPRVMALYVKIQNPLSTAMDFGDWHGKNTAGMLLETEQFEEGYDEGAEEINARLGEFAQRPNNNQTDVMLRQYLKSLGYDGIEYDNHWEGEGKSYIAFDSSQLKLADPVTYDDNGNVIPLSQRFNERQADIRYSIKDEAQSDRMLLANTLMTAAQNDGERRRLNNYKAQMDKFEEIQQKLYTADEELSKAIRTGVKVDIDKARRERDGLTQQLIRADSKLLELQATKPLKELLGRVKEDVKGTTAQRGRERAETIRQKETQRRLDAVAKAKAQGAERVADVRQKETAKRQAAVARERDIKNQRIAEVKQAEKQKRQDAVAKERAKANARIAEEIARRRQAVETLRTEKNARFDAMVAKFQEARRKGIDSRSRTAIRTKIKNLHAQMTTQLLNPKENRYVPKPLLKTVAEILDEINLDSGRSEKLKAKLSELSGMYQQIASSNEYAFVFDPVVDDMIKQLHQMLLGMDDTSIYNMTREELTMVYQTMKAINHTVRNAVKLINYETEKNIFDIAKDLMRETGRANPIANKLGNKYLNATLRPDVFFKRLGGYVKNSAWQMLGDMLNEAQRKQTQIQMEGAAIFEELMRDTKAFDRMTDHKNLIDIGLRDERGNEVPVTMDIAIKIYMDTMAEDNARHLMGGGYTIPDMREYYKGSAAAAYGRGSVTIHGFGPLFSELNYQLRHAETDEERADIQAQIDQAEADAIDWVDKLRKNIYDQLGEYELEWIKAAEMFFNDYSQKTLNETTMAVYGFEKATVPYYVPIHTDSAYRQANFESISRDMSLENSGFMKARVEGAKNPMLAEGIVDVINGQIDKVAKYAAMMPAIRNFQKVYGKSTAGFENSVQNAVRSKFGNEALKYIENIITDMTSPRRTEGGLLGDFADRLRGNLAQAALTVNPRVALEQVTSYPKAAVVVGYEPLIKAFRDIKDNPVRDQEAREEIAKWTPLMWYRMQGYFDRDIGDLRNDKQMLNKVNKKLKFITGWIEAVEGATVGQMWYAAQYYVEDTTDLERGSDEFMQETAKVFNRIVEQTQANYTMFQRPDILRNPNAIVKQLTMFMTERLQNANMVIDAVGTYNAYLKDFRNGENDVTEDDMKQAKQTLVRTASSLIAATASSVALKLAVDALMYSMKGYRDEDEELTMASITGQVVENFFESAAGNFLWGSELFSIMRSVVTDETYYGISLGGVETFTDALNALVKTMQEPTWENWKKSIKTGMQMLGIPLNNGIKIYNAIAYRIKDVQEGNGWGTYASELKLTEEQIAKQLYNAAITDNDKRLEKLFEHYGTEAAADAAFAKHIKGLYQNDELSAEETIAQLKEYASMSEYDAKLAVDKLRFEKEHGFDYNDMKQQYLDGNITDRDAVKWRAEYGDQEQSDAEKEVNQWRMKKETGFEYDKIKDYLTSGDITKQQAIEYRMEYGGQELEDATVYITKLMGEIETGIPYDKVEDYYRDGLISYDELVDYYMQYWSYDELKAIQVADKRMFIGTDESLADASLAAVSGYYGYCDEADVDKRTYLTAYQFCYAVRADKDANGKSISGTALKKKLVYIDGLNLQPYQKTAVAKAIGITDKQLKKYKAAWL